MKKANNEKHFPVEYKSVFLNVSPEQVHRSYCSVLDDGNENSELLIAEGNKVKEAKGVDFSRFVDSIAEDLEIESDQIIPLATFDGDPGAQWLFVCKEFEKNGLCPVYYFSDGASKKVSRSLTAWLKCLSKDEETETPVSKKTNAKNKSTDVLLRPKINKLDTSQKLDLKNDYFIWGSTTGRDWLEVSTGKRALKPKKGRWTDSERDKIMDSLSKGISIQKIWGEAIATMERGTGEWLDCFIMEAISTYLPVISPETKEIIESFQPKNVEFLPLRYRISSKKEGDFFVLNPTLIVDCLDQEKSGLPHNPKQGQTSEEPNLYKPKPIIDPKRLTNELIFRPLHMHSVIFFHNKICQKLVEAKLSGLVLATADEYPGCVWGGNGHRLYGK